MSLAWPQKKWSEATTIGPASHITQIDPFAAQNRGGPLPKGVEGGHEVPSKMCRRIWRQSAASPTTGPRGRKASALSPIPPTPFFAFDDSREPPRNDRGDSTRLSRIAGTNPLRGCCVRFRRRRRGPRPGSRGRISRDNTKICRAPGHVP